MPVYEYQCKACSRDFEYQQRMTDPDKTTCEICGGALERLISRTAFALKGGGWYKDLYASPKPEKANGKADAASGDSGSAAKADAPAAKSSEGSAGSNSSGGASSTTSNNSSSSGSAGSSSAAAAKAP